MSPPPSMMAAAAAALQLVFLHAGLGARDHRLHRVLAQHAGLAHAVELFLGVDHHEVVQEVLGEHELGVGQFLAQRVVLVDRHVVAVARVDLHQADAALLELQFAQPLDHHLRVLAVAAVAHVLDRDLDVAAHRFGVRAAHRIDHGRLAVERHQHVAAQRVPFPMAGQPGHAGAEAPVARAARHDDGVELVLAHLGAQRMRSGACIRPPRTAPTRSRGSTACRACWRTAATGRACCGRRPRAAGRAGGGAVRS